MESSPLPQPWCWWWSSPQDEGHGHYEILGSGLNWKQRNGLEHKRQTWTEYILCVQHYGGHLKIEASPMQLLKYNPSKGRDLFCLVLCYIPRTRLAVSRGDIFVPLLDTARVAFTTDTAMLGAGHCHLSLDIAVPTLGRMNSVLCILLRTAGFRFRIWLGFIWRGKLRSPQAAWTLAAREAGSMTIWFVFCSHKTHEVRDLWNMGGRSKVLVVKKKD